MRGMSRHPHALFLFTALYLFLLGKYQKGRGNEWSKVNLKGGVFSNFVLLFLCFFQIKCYVSVYLLELLLECEWWKNYHFGWGSSKYMAYTRYAIRKRQSLSLTNSWTCSQGEGWDWSELWGNIRIFSVSIERVYR